MFDPFFEFLSENWTNFVIEAKMVNEDSVVVPREATQEDLLVVHTSDYLDSLRVSKDVNLSTSKNLENFSFL